MEVLKEDFLEVEVGIAAESFQKFLDSQRELFHSQIDQLQKIVVTQCKLSGVNPLSQEMAAGALSINIRKRPRDLLNPMAIKYMQSVFSIKDAISKKECREISAMFGVTLSQVREFFASQRSSVRKFVLVSREKAISSSLCAEPQDGIPACYDNLKPIDPVLLNIVGPTSTDEASCCLSQDNTLPGIDGLDKKFVENIFNLMRKEEAFSGQVKLMDWIMQINNSSVLCWFMNKGGLMILTTWLSQAAIEEQTSLLLVILKVLCLLPLHKALPEHMSAILPSVNRLRFYRASDISSRARFLLSRWSKLLARSQARKKPNGMKSCSDAQELMLKHSIGDDLRKSVANTPENILTAHSDNSDNFRKLEPTPMLKLLPASSDDSTKKNILGIPLSQIRERRKVQLVEQPGQRTPGRSQQTTRATPMNQGRPMSADDIQKEKMRAQFLQSKYAKNNLGSENKEVKSDSPQKPLTSQTNVWPPASEVLTRPNIEELHLTSPSELPAQQEACLDLKLRIDEPPSKKCRKVQIPWKTPSELKLNHVWRSGAGENSKEVEVQKNRNRREKETIYHSVLEIPSNPKGPWDLEMDYDDSLTPEIPTEQLPDADGTETQFSLNPGVNNAEIEVIPNQSINSYTSQAGNAASIAEPDLQLLAVLLKNPELVFALTSGQASNLSNEETMKLLDRIKAGGAGLSNSFNALDKQVEEKVEVSLPSPTPPSNPGMSGWRPEAARNPFSQQNASSNRGAYTSLAVAPSNLAQQHISGARPQSSQPASIPPAILTHSHPRITSMMPEKYLPPVRHNSSTSFSTTQTTAPFIKNLPLTSTPPYSLHSAASPSNFDRSSNINQTFTSNTLNTEDRQHIPISHAPLLPTAAQPQTPQLLQQQFSLKTSLSRPAYSSKQISKQSPMFDSRGARQSFPSHSRSMVNQTNYNPPFGEHMLPPQWEGSEYVEEEKFELWSPENSPMRNPGHHIMRRNFPEHRRNPGRNYKLDGSRQRSSTGSMDYSRHGNRWPDRRR